MASPDKTPQERIPDRLVPYAEEYHAFLKLEAEVVRLCQELESLQRVNEATNHIADTQIRNERAVVERLREALRHLHDHCRVDDTQEAGVWLEEVDALVASPDKPPDRDRN